MRLFTFFYFFMSFMPLLGCIWGEKKLLMCLFVFLCFFMSFMLLLGCIFVPFVLFMRVKSFCKKIKGLKWPWWPHLHYYSDVPYVFMFYVIKYRSCRILTFFLGKYTAVPYFNIFNGINMQAYLIAAFSME